MRKTRFTLSLLALVGALIATSGCGGGTETVYVPIDTGGGGSYDGGGFDGDGGGGGVDPARYFDAYDLQGTFQVVSWTNVGGPYGYPGETEDDYWQKDAILSFRATDATHGRIRGDYVFDGKISSSENDFTILNSSRTGGILESHSSSGCRYEVHIRFTTSGAMTLETFPNPCNSGEHSTWHWQQVGHLPYN